MAPKAVRDDAEKPPVDEGCLQYFPRALMAVATVSAAGAHKYNVELVEKNWLGLSTDRITNSLVRHIIKEGIEGAWDRDSLILHKAHIAWNALAALEKVLYEGRPLTMEVPTPTPMTPTQDSTCILTDGKRRRHNVSSYR